MRIEDQMLILSTINMNNIAQIVCRSGERGPWPGRPLQITRSGALAGSPARATGTIAARPDAEGWLSSSRTM